MVMNDRVPSVGGTGPRTRPWFVVAAVGVLLAVATLLALLLMRPRGNSTTIEKLASEALSTPNPRDPYPLLDSARVTDRSQPIAEPPPTIADISWDSIEGRVRGLDDRLSPAVEIEIHSKPLADFTLLETTSEAGDRQWIGMFRLDAERRFRASVDRGVAHEVVIRAPGYGERLFYPVYSGQFVDCAMTPAASLQVLLVQSGTGAPIAKASVELVGRTGWRKRGTTDASGISLLEGLPEGEAFLSVRSILGAAEIHKVQLVSAVQLEQRIGIDPGVGIVGTVVDDELGTPISDSKVGWSWAMMGAVSTDLDGRFHFAGFNTRMAETARHNILVAEAPGYARSVERLSWPGSGDVIVHFRLARAHSFIGRVVNSVNQPITNARVSVISGAVLEPHDVGCSSTLTTEDGHFVVNGLRADVPHTIVVGKQGYASALRHAPNIVAESTHVGVITLQSPGSISGVLLDAKKGKAGVLIQLLGSGADHRALRPKQEPISPSDRSFILGMYAGSRRRISGPRGEFSFGGLEPGSYQILANVPGVQGQVCRSVQLEAGAQVEDLVLDGSIGGLLIRGKVVDSSGRLRSNIHLNLARESPANAWTIDVSTDAFGRFVFSGLEPLEYRLRLGNPVLSAELGPQPYILASSLPLSPSEQEHTITLLDGRWLSGRIHGQAAHENDRYWIALQCIAIGWTSEVLTDGLGRFRVAVPANSSLVATVKLMRPSSVDASPTSPGAAPLALVEIPSNQTELEIQLSPLPK